MRFTFSDLFVLFTLSKALDILAWCKKYLNRRIMEVETNGNSPGFLDWLEKTPPGEFQNPEIWKDDTDNK